MAGIPLPGIEYKAFVDVAGGSGSDSFACAVGHRRMDEGNETCVVDAIWFTAPPFDPAASTLRCAGFLRQWGITEVCGDNYAGDWPTTEFARHGIRYSKSPLTKSELYLHTLPFWTASRVKVIDHQRAIDQLAGLRRKASSTGREVVDHARGFHDDLANVVSGVLWMLWPVAGPLVMSGPIIVTQQVGNAESSPLMPSSYMGGGEGNLYGVGADRFSYPSGGTW